MEQRVDDRHVVACYSMYSDGGRYNVPHVVMINSRLSDSGCPVKHRFTSSALLRLGCCGERCVSTVARIHDCSTNMERWSRQALAHVIMMVQRFYLSMISLQVLMASLASLVSDLCRFWPPGCDGAT